MEASKELGVPEVDINGPNQLGTFMELNIWADPGILKKILACIHE